MIALGPLVCPNGHSQPDPPVIPGKEGLARDGTRVLALLAEGRCPACPLVPLTSCMAGETPVPAVRCGCCGAAWHHGIDWWAAVELGALTRR